MADNFETVFCPACGAEMKKCLDIDKNINIDICIDGCGSLYFDNREFEKYDEPHENADEILKLLEGKHYTMLEDEGTRKCAACQYTMIKMGTGIPDVQIDVCATCGGKFLDNGELQKIRNTVVKQDGNLPRILNCLYESTVVDIIGKDKYDNLDINPRREFFTNITTHIIKNCF